MSNILNFLPQLQQVNVIYSNFIECDELEYNTYRKVVDFYYENKDVAQFEKMILDLLFEKEKQTTSIVLQSIRSEVEKNISIYRENIFTFDDIDPDGIRDNIELTYDREIEKLVIESNKHGMELCRVINIIDRKRELPEGVTHDDLWNTYETALACHREIVGKLHELYQKQAECKEEVKKYDINPFGDIFDLCMIFRSILEKYLPTETPNDEKKNIPQKSYFNMGLVSAIHELCNGKQFDEISELELYAILNNHPTPVVLKIKSGEKTRICYLIHRLSEKLKGGEKNEWRSEMLRRLDIAESYYASKYKEPESDIPSRKSEEFAKELKQILE